MFQGGTPSEFIAALQGAGASAAWVQDAKGDWYLYVVGAGFLNDAFQKAFPSGFPSATSMTLVAP